MDIMIIGSSSLNNISSNYIIKLNDEESLLVKKEKKDENPYSEKLKENQELQTKKDIKSDASQELSEDEEKMLGDLQARDTEVRAHEAAHQAAGGGMTGAASYTYQQGPDGKMYAIGGEVSISIKTGSTPEETIANARQIVAAAMAPGNPSPQDHSVASSAKIMEMKAQQQLAKAQQEEILGNDVYLNTNKDSESDIATDIYA